MTQTRESREAIFAFLAFVIFNQASKKNKYNTADYRQTKKGYKVQNYIVLDETKLTWGDL